MNARLALRLTAAALAFAFAAGALAQADAKEAEDEGEAGTQANTGAQAPGKDDSRLPRQDLTGQILYEFLLAEIAAQRNNPGLASQAYVDLSKRTRDPRIARRATEIANFARLPGLALEAARIWQESEPESVPALQAVSALLINARRVEEAEPFLGKLLASEGAAANGFMQINRFLAANPDRPVNLGIVRRLAAVYPELPQARFAVAQAAAVANDQAAALQEIRRAAVLRPDWDMAAIFEAQLLQGNAPGQAQERLAGFLEKYPASREVRLNYARLLVLDKKLPEARSQFQALLAAFPDNADVLYSVGLMAVQLKDFDVGEAHLKRLLSTEFRDKNGVRFTLGQIAEERKDFPAALGWYLQVESGEQFIPSRLRYAQVLSRQGRLAEARDFLQKVNAGAQQAQVRIAEAQILRDANQHGEAFKVLSQALEASPDQPDLLYDHALTAEKLERFDILEANLTRLIKERPEHAHAYNALGYSLADRNVRLEEALKLIRKALDLAPNDLYIVDSMGWVLYRLGDYPRALEYLRRAWDGRPDGEIGAHLGEVLWVMGERAEAERIWQEATQKAPENEALQKTIKRFKP